MLEITRIDRVGVVVPALPPQVALFEELFGFRAGQPTIDADGSAVRVRLSMPGRSDVDWEVAAPTLKSSHLQGFIDGPAGPGIHNLVLRVADLDGAVEELRSLEIEPWRGDPGDGSEPGEECFIHPARGGQGFLFRLRGPDDGGERPPPPEDHEGALGIVTLDHLSHAHGDRDALTDWYERVFGMRLDYRGQEDERPFVTTVIDTPTEQMHWEVLQPVGERSFIHRFLERRGPGIHHVTFQVGDWERAIAACEAYGVTTFGGSDGVRDGWGWAETFLHPRQAGGMLVQLFWEEHPGVWI